MDYTVIVSFLMLESIKLLNLLFLTHLTKKLPSYYEIVQYSIAAACIHVTVFFCINDQRFQIIVRLLICFVCLISLSSLHCVAFVNIILSFLISIMLFIYSLNLNVWVFISTYLHLKSNNKYSYLILFYLFRSRL